MKKTLLKSLLAVALLLVCGNAWGQTGTIAFGSNGTKITGTSVTGTDSNGLTWTITTVTSNPSFTQQPTYSQVGSSSKPATSITFTTTLPSNVTVTAFSAKFGGFTGTAGNITLKVGDTTVGSGSLNASTDVTVTNTISSMGNSLTITVTDIDKGVKCYNISYTYSVSAVLSPTISPNGGNFAVSQVVTISCATEGATIYYSTDGNENPTNPYSGPFTITETTTVKAKATKGGDVSDVVSATFTKKNLYTVSFSSLGESAGSQDVFDGEVLESESVPTPTAPAGWTYVGWTENDSYTMSGTAPAFFDTSASITGNTTLYAVFSKSKGNWTKVTTAPVDWSGEYLLVYEGTDVNYAWTGVDAGQCHVDVTIADGQIASKPVEAATLTIATMDGGYSIQVNGGQYIGRSSYNNGIEFSNDAQLNTLSVDENYNTVITGITGQSENVVMRYNSSSGVNNERFRYYKSGQQPVQLYKLSGETTTAYATSISTYTLTIAESGYSSLYLGFNTEAPAGVTVFIATAADASGVTLTPIEGVIPAEEGVIVKGTPSTDVTFTEFAGSLATVTGNMLLGTLVPKSFEGILGDYMLKGGLFCPITGGTLPANKAYLTGVDLSGGAIGIRIDGATMVEQMLQENHDAAIYDLQGRQAENVTKGLYIVGGKKVLVK